MQRLQSNLAYLAAIADRSHKPISTIQPHPQIMAAPTLATAKVEKTADGTATSNNASETAEIIKKQYIRLQELFPGAAATKPQRESGPEETSVNTT